jgi:hypothetical protein
MNLRWLMAHGASAAGVLTALTAAPHLLVMIAAGAGLLALLIILGIALPAVWSSKPARRKAATAVLGQILDTLDRHGDYGDGLDRPGELES